MGFFLFLTFANCVEVLSLETSVFVIYALTLLAVFLGFGLVGVDLIGFKLVGVDLLRELVYTLCVVPWFPIILRLTYRKWFTTRIRPLYRILFIVFLIHVQPISAMDVGIESDTLTGCTVIASSFAVHTFPATERFTFPESSPNPREVSTPTYTWNHYENKEDVDGEVEVSNHEVCPPCSESSESDSECSDSSLYINACSPRHESESDDANDDEMCPPREDVEENVEGQNDEDDNYQMCLSCQDPRSECSDSAGSHDNDEMSLPCQDPQSECSDSAGSLNMNGSDEWNNEMYPPSEDLEDVEEIAERGDNEDDIIEEPGNESYYEGSGWMPIDEVFSFYSTFNRYNNTIANSLLV